MHARRRPRASCRRTGTGCRWRSAAGRGAADVPETAPEARRPRRADRRDRRSRGLRDWVAEEHARPAAHGPEGTGWFTATGLARTSEPRQRSVGQAARERTSQRARGRERTTRDDPRARAKSATGGLRTRAGRRHERGGQPRACRDGTIRYIAAAAHRHRHSVPVLRDDPGRRRGARRPARVGASTRAASSCWPRRVRDVRARLPRARAPVWLVFGVLRRAGVTSVEPDVNLTRSSA